MSNENENDTPEVKPNKEAEARLKRIQAKLKEGETAELTIHGNVIINR